MTQLGAREEAIGWTIRLRDPARADWDAFTLWLEADPAHAAAYNDVTLADAAMVEVLSPAGGMTRPPAHVEAANDNKLGLFRRHAALAAALFVAVLAYPAYRVAVPTYSIETALGEQRSVTLDDGTVIDLNGGTRLMLDRSNPRLAMLDRGEARFSVVHDAKRPFTVVSGQATIEDVGTVFNVAREAQQTEVSVAEGAVRYNPAREAMLLKPGQVLRDPGSGAKPVVGPIDPAVVGGWRQGRLDFAGAAMADVAPDLARLLGAPVVVDPAIADRRFTGTVLIDRSDPGAMDKVAALMGVSAHRTAKGWRLGN